MKQKKRHAEIKHRDFPVCTEGQLYARVTKMLGNGRLLATGVDGAERPCKIRGSMRKKVWIAVGDTVLLALRELGSDGKADVVFRYTDDEVRRLHRMGEEVIVKNAEAVEEDDGVVFEHGSDEEIDLDTV